MHILFICTGNICRSPMAEGLARTWPGGAEFSSAGLSALSGQEASTHARAVMQENGCDIESHRARLVTEEILAAADLVLVMTMAHERWLCSKFPEQADKVRRLGDAAGEGRDVADPYGGDLDDYRASFADIKMMLERIPSWESLL